MRVLQGQTISLPGYFEDANNNPIIGKTLSECKFDIFGLDTGYSSIGNNATGEEGQGWYSYNWTCPEISMVTGGHWYIYVMRDSTAALKNFPGGLIEAIGILKYDITFALQPNTSAQNFAFPIPGETNIPIYYHSMYIDMVNITKDTVIRISCKIDGTNSRTIDSISWNTQMEQGVPISSFMAQGFIGVSFQSLEAEPTAKNIPIRFLYEIYPHVHI